MTSKPKPEVTIFVGTTNRIETLRRTVAAFSKLKTPHEIVIVDNGTDLSACRLALRSIRPKVKKIYNLPRCVSMAEVTFNYNIAIRDQYESGKHGEWFAVSDVDTCFEGTNEHALAAYIKLARQQGTAVGPHLRVDKDIPAGYPLRSRVLACETWMLYANGMQRENTLAWSRTQTDTTFHLFPATRFFDRLHMDPIRVGPPFDAMHLDWYIDVAKPTQENYLYITDERKMGSWGRQWIQDYWMSYQYDGPEAAFERLMAEPKDDLDLCNNSFMLSWAYQFGVGVEKDLGESQRWLERAIPRYFDRYWNLQPDWGQMIYNDDFSSLGWEN